MAILTSLPRSIEVIGLLGINLRALLLLQRKRKYTGDSVAFLGPGIPSLVSHCVFVGAVSTEFEPTIHLLCLYTRDI